VLRISASLATRAARSAAPSVDEAPTIRGATAIMFPTGVPYLLWPVSVVTLICICLICMICICRDLHLS
jgi:hypothetical protein